MRRCSAPSRTPARAFSRLLPLLLAVAVPAAYAESPQEPIAEPKADHALVAGFERFFQALPTDEATPERLAAGGRLLLGELNCLSCHAAEAAVREQLLPKTAPRLTDVAGRLKLEAIRELLLSPHAAKPGTTMPDLLAGLPEAERRETVDALVHFLAGTGSVTETAPSPAAVKQGDELFHSLGCVACHAPRKAPPAAIVDPTIDPEDAAELAAEQRAKGPQTATYIPLGNVAKKYTLASLTQFLRDPRASRPSARMPHFQLKDDEARALASYFFAGIKVAPNLKYTVYHVGGLSKLPDFAEMKPAAEGETAGFDLTVAGRTNDFAVRFTGWLHLPKDGDYRFWLGSDDGSRLIVDGKTIVDVDGVHPHQTHDGVARLTAGPHEVVVEYFQGGGEWTVELEVSGPSLPRQPASGLVSLSRDGLSKPMEGGTAFVRDEEKARRGATLFAEVGCAACHELKQGDQRIASLRKAIPLAELRPGEQGRAGCLATESGAALPRYSLTERQRVALVAAVTRPVSEAGTPADRIDHEMLTFNCYACHERGGKGGVEQVRNGFFESTIKEIGDEGRLPPSLTGVGDKLRREYFDEVFNNGPKDRPYVKARMPRFGAHNLPGLADALTAADARSDANLASTDESENKLRAHGRTLMGDKGLSCIKCHPFNQLVEPGIQAINLNAMHKRLREDWFYRYMLDPPAYRPGTRMPAFYPNGKSVLDSVLGGSTPAQLRAMWVWLKDGSNAAIPSGLVKNPIVLKPEKEPIIYRNFIEGLSPRGIAVGYPEQVNIGFDADRMALGLIWQGAFIDASKHWNDRGPGFQVPLGDNPLELERGVLLARLDSLANPWPKQSAEELGWTFRGYRLDAQRRPTFLYRLPGVAVSDQPIPIAAGDGQPPRLKRVITLRPEAGAAVQKSPPYYFRLERDAGLEAVGPGGEPTWRFRTKDGLTLTIQPPAGSEPFLRDSEGEKELLVPVDPLIDGGAKVVVEYQW